VLLHPLREALYCIDTISLKADHRKVCVHAIDIRFMDGYRFTKIKKMVQILSKHRNAVQADTLQGR
jgi:hypothetical protein